MKTNIYFKINKNFTVLLFTILTSSVCFSMDSEEDELLAEGQVVSFSTAIIYAPINFPDEVSAKNIISSLLKTDEAKLKFINYLDLLSENIELVLGKRVKPTLQQWNDLAETLKACHENDQVGIIQAIYEKHLRLTREKTFELLVKQKSDFKKCTHRLRKKHLGKMKEETLNFHRWLRKYK